MFLRLWNHRCSSGDWGFGTFVSLVCLTCILSISPPPSKKKGKCCTKHSKGKSSRSKCCFPSMTNKALLCREVLQEHPDLSSTSFYSQRACVLPAPLVQTPHLSQRALPKRGRVYGMVGGSSWSRASLSDAVCVWVCAWAERSTYETAQPSMKSPLFSFKGPTWIFNDELVSSLRQIYSMTPFYWMHI